MVSYADMFCLHHGNRIAHWWPDAEFDNAMSQKNLYGSKSAPRNWFKHLSDNLEKVGLKQQIDVDACLDQLPDDLQSKISG